MVLYLLILFFHSLFSRLEAVESHDRFVVVTPPKAGTHLLTKAMEKLTHKRCRSIFSSYELTREEWENHLAKADSLHAFIQIHAIPESEQVLSLKSLGCKVIFLIRDPRDQALSLLFFIEERRWYLGPLSLDREPYRSLSFGDKLHEIITGERTGFCGVRKLFQRYLPWAFYGQNFVLTIRFEDLVGEEGGGSRELQLQAMKKIASFLHMNLSDAEIAKRSRGIYGKPGEKTFRKGKIGEWRKYFQPRHLQEMQNRFGSSMQQLGYH
jgi:Sulfotransferase domain